MTFVTDSALSAAQVDANGVRNWAAGAHLLASDLASAGQDAQAAANAALLPGVLTGGLCTASGLLVVIPAGTSFFARQVWTTVADINKVVSDNATTYLWCCSNGNIGTSASEGVFPTDFDATNCCLLCKATALSGVLTIDNSLQWRARSANPLLRTVIEGADNFNGVMDTIPSGTVGVIGPNSQQRIYDKMSVRGRLILNGKMRIA